MKQNPSHGVSCVCMCLWWTRFCEQRTRAHSTVRISCGMCRCTNILYAPIHLFRPCNELVHHTLHTHTHSKWTEHIAHVGRSLLQFASATPGVLIRCRKQTKHVVWLRISGDDDDDVGDMYVTVVGTTTNYYLRIIMQIQEHVCVCVRSCSPTML